MKLFLSPYPNFFTASGEKAGGGGEKRKKNVEYRIDKMNPNDWEQVRSIYLEGIATGHATFEAEAPEWGKWDSNHLADPRLVARTGGKVAGWAALSRVSIRRVYSGVVEVSIYIESSYRGRGIGSALLAALIEASEKMGIWTLQAGIFPENIASISLHQKHGFRILGRRVKIGKMTFGELRGTWRDVILMERRSALTGID